ncbi:SDR family NAD(P)-dependent oxidoreductase [Microbacterium sp.]|jgi:NAD(P)-dependent dehydrogenase (short-subunit alcohol dehydrogenase family)|uniref:SDR family NAD(P)-dependent oxidoreductase n=1 Tax=Microbacterium sp. TaxID=51671 RepID=UPI0037C812DB
MKLDGKVAIVTGGAQGIGAAIATRLSEHGARVAIADLQTDGTLAEQLRSAGGVATTTFLDVADEASVVQAFDSVESELGPVDILVNNAGIGTPVALLVDTTTQDWERTFRINLTGSMMCTREAFRRMIPRGGGTVLNIASNVAKRGVPLRSAYTSSKWAMLGLTETAALEGAPHGIRVNALLPGNVQTPHLTEVVQMHADAEGKTFDEYTEMLKGLSPMGRYVELDEIADVALFLTSSDSSAMTGQSVNVTAGWIMH